MRAIRQLERKRGSRAIALIHRQETLALLGFPLARYININGSEEILRAIKLTDPDVPINLTLHTPGWCWQRSKSAWTHGRWLWGWRWQRPWHFSLRSAIR